MTLRSEAASLVDSAVRDAGARLKGKKAAAALQRCFTQILNASIVIPGTGAKCLVLPVNSGA